MRYLALITTAECRLFHAPRGGDSGASSFVPTARIFQSTPPTRGATALCVPMFCGSLFQSTPPRGGRLRQPAQGSGASDHFNPRPREGGDDVGFVSRVPPSSISIHAPREGGDSKDAQFYLRIFDKQVELLRFLGKIRGGCLRNPEKDRRFLGKSLANLPAISGHLDFAGAGRRVPDTRAPYHCRAGRRVSEDQGILRQIGALRTEMLHFFLILLPQIVKAQTVFLRIHDGQELCL